MALLSERGPWERGSPLSSLQLARARASASVPAYPAEQADSGAYVRAVNTAVAFVGHGY